MAGHYLEYYRDGKRITEKATSKANALYLLSKRIDSPAPDKRLLGDIFSEWIDTRGNVRVEASIWKSLEPHFGQRQIGAVTRQHITAYVTERKRAGVKNTSVVREIALIRALLRHAGHDTRICSNLGLPIAHKRLDKYLSADEWKQLVDALPDAHRPLFVFLYETGCRLNEVRTLDESHIDYDRSLAWVEGKTGKGERQVVYLSPKAKECLPALFSVKLKYPTMTLRYYADKSGLNDILKKSGRSPINGCHWLRHAAISRWVSSGVPVDKVARLARHTNINQTFRYAHLSPENLVETLAKLDGSNS